jgi:hypothetical protein
MFKVRNPVQNCILFEFKKQKDLALSFCRVQEYYESDKKALKNQFFSFYDFINESMDDNGNINYFSFWSGFNLPSRVWNLWSQKRDLTLHENKLAESISANMNQNIINGVDFYIIGVIKGDTVCTNHEIAHALYDLNLAYRFEMDYLIYDFYKKFRMEYSKMIKRLKELGYNKEVLKDEVQAYMATSTKKELVEDFGLNYAKLLPIIKQYKKVLLKYNTISKTS